MFVTYFQLFRLKWLRWEGACAMCQLDVFSYRKAWLYVRGDPGGGEKRCSYFIVSLRKGGWRGYVFHSVSLNSLSKFHSGYTIRLPLYLWVATACLQGIFSQKGSVFSLKAEQEAEALRMCPWSGDSGDLGPKSSSITEFWNPGKATQPPFSPSHRLSNRYSPCLRVLRWIVSEEMPRESLKLSEKAHHASGYGHR